MSMPFPQQIELPPAEPMRGGADSISSPRSGESPVDFLEDAIDALHAYLRVEGDPQAKAAATAILNGLQKLIAQEQTTFDKATGAGPGAALMRKQSQRDRIARGY
jgi:hypothetical protein